MMYVESERRVQVDMQHMDAINVHVQSVRGSRSTLFRATVCGQVDRFAAYAFIVRRPVPWAQDGGR